MDDWVQSARTTEDASNTFSGIALHSRDIVGVHIVPRFEEWEQVGAHIAGFWVRPAYRGLGIAALGGLAGSKEIPGVNSQGASRDELMGNLKSALLEMFEMNRESARSAAGDDFEEIRITA